MRLSRCIVVVFTLCALLLPALAVPGAMRWSDAVLKPFHAAASPDGSLLAIERGFGKVAVFRTDTLTEVREIDADVTGYPCYVFSADNTLLAVSTYGETRCYVVASGELVGSFPGIARAFTAKGVLVTTEGRSITYRDPRTGNPQRTLAAIGVVMQLTLSPKGDTLAYLTEKALVLAKSTGEKLRQWPSESGFMRVLTFSPDGSLLAGNTKPDRVAVWRIADGTEVRALALDHVVISDARITPDNNTLYYTAAGAEIHRLSLADGKEGDQLPMGATPQMIALTTDGTRLVAASQQRVAVWNPAANSTVAELNPPTSTGASVAFSPDDTLLATVVNGGVALRKVADGTVVRMLPCPGGIQELLFAPDGVTLAALNGSRVQVLRVVDGSVQYSLQPTPRLWLKSIAFSGDGKLLFVGGQTYNGQQGKITIWRMADGTLERTLDTGGRGLWCLAASANGNYVASGSNDTWSVTVMNAFEGTKVRTIDNQRCGQRSLAFTPAGDLLSAAAGEILLTNITNGTVKHHFTERNSPFVLSADGATIISNGESASGPAYVWSLATGKELATIRIDTQSCGIALSHDNKLAATSTSDGLAVWDVK